MEVSRALLSVEIFDLYQIYANGSAVDAMWQV
jgi:hypothetical protein